MHSSNIKSIFAFSSLVYTIDGKIKDDVVLHHFKIYD